jgi:hypothetical protein
MSKRQAGPRVGGGVRGYTRATDQGVGAFGSFRANRHAG